VSGDPGSTEGSWEFRVFFDPSGGDGGLRLGDHLEDEERTAEKRALARQRFKARQGSDDLYSGAGSVPCGDGGEGAPTIIRVGTVHEAEHPPLPLLAPADVLAAMPSVAEARHLKRREAHAAGALLRHDLVQRHVNYQGKEFLFFYLKKNIFVSYLVAPPP
jgi:hypothetical protein